MPQSHARTQGGKCVMYDFGMDWLKQNTTFGRIWRLSFKDGTRVVVMQAFGRWVIKR